MKKVNWILLLLFWATCLSSITAQWEPSAGPSHYNISGIKRFNDHLFATSRGMMFSREASGGQWQQASNVPPGFWPSYLFETGGYLITYSNLGIYRTSDGVNWSDIAPAPDRNFNYRLIDNVLFAQERFQSPKCMIYRSENAGATWDTVLESVSINQPYFFLGKVNGGLIMWFQPVNQSAIHIYQSADLGKHWTDIGAISISSTGQFSNIVQNGNRIFVPNTHLNPGVNYTDDGGLTWNFVNTGLPASGLYTPPTLYSHGNNLFLMAGINNQTKYYRSLNNGLNWTGIANGLNGYSGILAAENAIYLLCNYNQLQRSTDEGQTWSVVPGFTAELDFRPNSVWQDGNSVYLYGFGGLYTSVDKGIHWALDRSGMLPFEASVKQLQAFDNALYALTDGGLFRSTDLGEHWLLLQQGMTQLPVFLDKRKIVVSNNSLILATETGIYRSVDQGATWQDNFYSATGEKPSYLTKKGGTLFVLTLYTNRLFRSDDDGVFWSFVADLPTAPYSFLLSTSSNLICGGGNTYLVSENDGQSWTSRTYTGLGSFFGWNMVESEGRYYVRGTPNGTPSVGISSDLMNWTKYAMDSQAAAIVDYEIYVKDSLVWTNYYPSGVYFSHNYGKTWEKKPAVEIPETSIYTFQAIGNTVFAGTALYGVWRSPLSDFLSVGTISQEQNTVSASLFPNPASSSLTLRYQLDAPTDVSIRLLNGQGVVLLSRELKNKDTGPNFEILAIPETTAVGHYWVEIRAGSRRAWLPLELH